MCRVVGSGGATTVVVVVAIVETGHNCNDAHPVEWPMFYSKWQLKPTFTIQNKHERDEEIKKILSTILLSLIFLGVCVCERMAHFSNELYF